MLILYRLFVVTRYSGYAVPDASAGLVQRCAPRRP